MENKMTERERQDFVRALRMSGLANPKKWSILNQAADELEKLDKQLKEACDRLHYFDEQQLRL
jgi:hypothetical protein